MVVVDSGSTDETINIAKSFNCKIIEIKQSEFTYGYSLNKGLSCFPNADIGVSLSGHCIPKNKFWLKNIIKPLLEQKATLSFGSHVGAKKVRTSEQNYFKYKYAKLKKGYVPAHYFNNGNSAFLIKTWLTYKFDETIIAQEDIEMAIRVVKDNGKVFYSPKAMIIHIHNDRNKSLYKRLYNELLSEYKLNVHTRTDLILYSLKSFMYIYQDVNASFSKGVLKKAFPGIIEFRTIQSLSALKTLINSFNKK